MQSKKVWKIYDNLIKEFGNELDILLKIPKETLLGKGFDEKKGFVKCPVCGGRGEVKETKRTFLEVLRR